MLRTGETYNRKEKGVGLWRIKWEFSVTKQQATKVNADRKGVLHLMYYISMLCSLGPLGQTEGDLINILSHQPGVLCVSLLTMSCNSL